MSKPDKYELLAETAKRRGFFWPSFEIYGGVSGFIDYGPLGIGLRRKIEEKWRDFFIRREGLLELDTPIIVPERVFEASGHVEHFKDPVVECVACKRSYRADHLLKEKTNINAEALSIEEMDREIRKNLLRCPECGGELSKPKQLGTMFKTTIGPYIESTAYGRPETAQGIFIDFKRLYEIGRERLPLGIAQIGRSLRNEVSPRQGPLRLRELNMMEFEFFFDPENVHSSKFETVRAEVLRLVPAEKRLKGDEEPLSVTVGEALERGYILNPWSAYFMVQSRRFVDAIGIPADRQRFHEKLPSERAHYSAQTYDHEVLLHRWGWVELAGHAYRTDFDLKAHMKGSGVDMRVFKPYDRPIRKTAKRLIPHLPVLGKKFGEKTKRIAEKIIRLDPNVVEKTLDAQGYVEIEGCKIGPEDVKIVEEVGEETGRRFVPHVVEPSFGSDRLLYAVLEYAYSRENDRVVLRIPRDMAPVQTAVLPLMAKDGLAEKALLLYEALLDAGFDVEYDETGSIGRRYARSDEAGIPVAVTVDYDTLKDDTVTLRNRDTWKQVRAKATDIPHLLRAYIHAEKEFDQLGKMVPGNSAA